MKITYATKQISRNPERERKKYPTQRKYKSIRDRHVAQLTEHAFSAPFSALEVTEQGEKESARRKKAIVNS